MIIYKKIIQITKIITSIYCQLCVSLYYLRSLHKTCTNKLITNLLCLKTFRAETNFIRIIVFLIFKLRVNNNCINMNDTVNWAPLGWVYIKNYRLKLFSTEGSFSSIILFKFFIWNANFLSRHTISQTFWYISISIS